MPLDAWTWRKLYIGPVIALASLRAGRSAPGMGGGWTGEVRSDIPGT